MAAAAVAVANTFSSDSDSASSGSGAASSSAAPSSALEASIFSAYLHQSGRNQNFDLSKIRSFLYSAAGRGGPFVACLICLERLRPTDPVWSCSASCYAIFHLQCIQSWARQSSSRLSPYKPVPSPETWNCPKCRIPYTISQIPKCYFCFCGKVEDPQLDPWILPHSCGEVCGRPLENSCGHRCLLLCHPGPCPPCPKLVNSRCFCGASEETRRCAHKHFSCNKKCDRLLQCNVHRCPQKCHDGPCPPCRVSGVFKCQCGKTDEKKECCEREFRCERPCCGMLRCGKHTCGRGCHAGPCGNCPMQGRRTCPCGKKEYKGVSCDVDVPTCGSTCEKMLCCGLHRCPERCHRGPCVETCRTVTVKSCRCGGLKKEVPCYQDLVCERKCQRVRDCGRHTCRRRCCDGSCPPCSEICGRRLRCNNHKCLSPCHRGTCAPCPLMVKIGCACGETSFEVPCGIEKTQKPPRCPKLCHVTRLCRHKSECRPHKCHYGACPSCKIICGETLACGHCCKERCHGPKPPPKPEFNLRPTKKEMNKRMEFTPGSSCPPCQEVIWKSCLGQHEERAMVCSRKTSFSCQNLCGYRLSCGNHYCTKPCHVLMDNIGEGARASNLLNQGLASPSVGFENNLAEPCEDCCLPCQKSREPKCCHSCRLRCHPGTCPPCEVLVKRSCHCGAMVHAFECTYYNNLREEQQQKIRSCGGPCHKKLPDCQHLCSEICHPGKCPSADKCLKKVTIRCACNNLKKEWQCQNAIDAYRTAGRDPKNVPKNQFSMGLLPCNPDCTRKVKTADSEIQQRKTVAPQGEIKDVNHDSKRKKRKEKVRETKKPSNFQAIKSTMQSFIVYLIIFLLIVTSIYYGYKGLYLLSDWMNEIDERRIAKRFPRT